MQAATREPKRLTKCEPRSCRTPDASSPQELAEHFEVDRYRALDLVEDIATGDQSAGGRSMAFLNWLFVALLRPARIDKPRDLSELPLVEELVGHVLVQHVRDDPGHSTRARFLLLFSTSEMSRQLPILHTTYQDDSLRGAVADVSRRAVRGLILRDGKILMVYSEVNGDYKFPGGGVKEGESDTDALARELSEECGYRLVRLGANFAVVAEYKHAMEADAAVPSGTARETWVLRALAAYGTENALPYAPPSDRSIISECGELD